MSFLIGQTSDAGEVTLDNSGRTVGEAVEFIPSNVAFHATSPTPSKCQYPQREWKWGVIIEICSISVGRGIVRLPRPFLRGSYSVSTGTTGLPYRDKRYLHPLYRLKGRPNSSNQRLIVPRMDEMLTSRLDRRKTAVTSRTASRTSSSELKFFISVVDGGIR